MEDLETRGLTRSSEWVVVNAGEGSEIPQKKVPLTYYIFESTSLSVKRMHGRGGLGDPSNLAHPVLSTINYPLPIRLGSDMPIIN